MKYRAEYLGFSFSASPEVRETDAGTGFYCPQCDARIEYGDLERVFAHECPHASPKEATRSFRRHSPKIH